MKRLQDIADGYLCGHLSETECAKYLAVEIMQLKVKDIATLAFLISYHEMPQPDTGGELSMDQIDQIEDVRSRQ